MWCRARISMMFGVVFVLALTACEQETVHPESLEEVLREQAEAGQKTAIEVDGRPVDVGEFEAYWRLHADWPRERALTGFVEQEVLFGPALERGFAEHEEVAVARKRAMVRRLLERTVEQEVTLESLRDEEIESMEEEVAASHTRPVGLRASHILMSIPRKQRAKKSGPVYDRAAAFADAKTAIERIRKTLPDEPTAFDLLAAKRTSADKIPAGLSVEVNTHLQFPASQTESELPENWISVVPEFRKPAVELARKGAFGRLSEPVRSPFGWHLIVVHEVLPGEKPDPDALRGAAVDRLLEKKRREAFAERMDTWREAADIQQYPRIIEEAGQIE